MPVISLLMEELKVAPSNKAEEQVKIAAISRVTGVLVPDQTQHEQLLTGLRPCVMSKAANIALEAVNVRSHCEEEGKVVGTDVSVHEP